MRSHAVARLGAHALSSIVLLSASATALGQPIFMDVTEAMGVNASHTGLRGDTWLCAGSGAGWADFDGDGDLDLYVTDQAGGPNHLFRNNHPSPFDDVASALGVALPASESTAVLWGDYDNDGDPDLFVGARGANTLFRNDGSDGSGGWIFTDVTSTAGVAGLGGRATGAVWGDYDNDGWLDLYVSNHAFVGNLPPYGPDPIHADELYHSVSGPGGERIFEEVAAQVLDAEVLPASTAHAAGFVDFDNDGDPDIVVVNEATQQSFPDAYGVTVWRNDGPDAVTGWRFTEVASQIGLELFSAPMGLAINDYNGDGWLDLAISDFRATHLFRNDGGYVHRRRRDGGRGSSLCP